MSLRACPDHPWPYVVNQHETRKAMAHGEIVMHQAIACGEGHDHVCAVVGGVAIIRAMMGHPAHGEG